MSRLNMRNIKNEVQYLMIAKSLSYVVSYIKKLNVDQYKIFNKIFNNKLIELGLEGNLSLDLLSGEKLYNEVKKNEPDIEKTANNSNNKINSEDYNIVKTYMALFYLNNLSLEEILRKYPIEMVDKVGIVYDMYDINWVLRLIKNGSNIYVDETDSESYFDLLREQGINIGLFEYGMIMN